jgi:hypothetical protein
VLAVIGLGAVEDRASWGVRRTFRDLAVEVLNTKQEHLP